MLSTDQESLDGGGSREGSVAERRRASLDGPERPSLLAGTELREDWCAEASESAAGPSSYPVLPEHSSDEGEEGYEGVAPHAESDDYTEVGEPGDTEVVFVKEGVNVWPSPRERIMGRLSLIKQHGVLFLAWLPYTPGSLLEDGSFAAAAADVAQSMHSAKDRQAYAVHPIPLSEVKAIHKHTPPLGAHKIVITLANGVSLAPLYFQQGGVKALFSALREHARLLRSADDPNTYIVNDVADPLQRSLTSMELTDVLLGGPPAGASMTFPPPSGPLSHEGWQAAESEVPLRAQLADLVDRFQRSLHTAKATASSFFSASLMPPFHDILEPDDAPRPPPPPGPIKGWTRHAPGPQQQGPAAAAARAGTGAGAAPRAPVAAPKGVPGLAGATFAATFSSSSPDLSGSEPGGGEAAAVPQPSPFAAAGSGPGPTGEAAGTQQAQQEGQRECEAADTELGVFELIERSYAGQPSLQLWTRPRPPPLSLQELETFCDAEGRLVDEGAFRQRVFYGGLEPEARPLGWKLLLGVFPAGSTKEERRAAAAAQLAAYQRLRGQWRSISRDQAARFAKWRERKARIDKDVRRTDRAVRLFSKERGQGQEMLRGVLLSYAMYNFDLGYCQGMSDLASPILHMMRSQVADAQLSGEEAQGVESQTFWCFARLMERMEPNFSTDCTGMHAQLVALQRLVQLLDPPLYAHLEACDCLNFYFCYRWCLILFKRELAFEEVLRLWEALWTGHPTPQLHLYICVAVLEHHRRRIMEEAHDLDALLKMCVELSGRLDLPALLRDAELLCSYAGQAGAECVAGLPVLPHHAAAVGAVVGATAATGAGAVAGEEEQAQQEAAEA